jgi:DNA-binding NarL/FixJ family response regulator
VETSTTCILLVDDYEPWRRYVSSTLHRDPRLQTIHEASDGLDAVLKAQELQPDLILLDISLPTLNGIEVARQIRERLPKAKILFVSQDSYLDVEQEALGTGASGYLVKGATSSELLNAVNAALRDERG